MTQAEQLQAAREATAASKVYRAAIAEAEAAGLSEAEAAEIAGLAYRRTLEALKCRRNNSARIV